MLKKPQIPAWCFSKKMTAKRRRVIAMQAALGRGRLCARSSCDAAPGCGRNGVTRRPHYL